MTTPSNSQASSLHSRRPSPRPRPPAQGAEVSTAAPSLHSRGDTFRYWLGQVLTRTRAYWLPPNLLVEPPASMAELAAYARLGGWTSKTDGWFRALGVLWYLLVGLPVTAVCRYFEWIAQRPARAVVAAFLWFVISRSTPGVWLADHIVRPTLAVVAWVFLP